MPHINEMKKSNFLKKEDCGPGILVTIKSVTEENVAREGAPEELKWCVHFNELEKPLVANSTNLQLIAAITQQDNTDDWPGNKVVLYNDPTISFAGKICGGIRVRAPRGTAAAKAKPAAKPAPAPQPAAEPEGEDPSVPF